MTFTSQNQLDQLILLQERVDKKIKELVELAEKALTSTLETDELLSVKEHIFQKRHTLMTLTEEFQTVLRMIQDRPTVIPEQE